MVNAATPATFRTRWNLPTPNGAWPNWPRNSTTLRMPPNTRRRAQSYRNIFDPSVGWFRPKNADGSWAPWPAEGRLKQGYGSIESNPYQAGLVRAARCARIG